MPAEPAASVLIPTRGRPALLAACVGALARQQGIERLGIEIIVAIDSPESGGHNEIEAAERAWREGGSPSGADLRVEVLPPPGDARPTHGCVGVRNQLAPTCRGRVFISINDDVRPEPGFIAAHLAAHARHEAEGLAPGLVVGDSRFAPLAELCPPEDPPTLFDRVATETGLIFFYDTMIASMLPQPGQPAPGPDHDWGYRHAFGLNVSLRRDLLLDVGGYTAAAAPYGYEDLELAHRLRSAHACPVRFEPAARAPHHHRYRARHVLDREFALGRAARAFAHARPTFAMDLFKTDLTDAAVLNALRHAIERDRADADRQANALLTLDRTPADVLTGSPADQRTVLQALADGCRGARRGLWRRGVLAEDEAMRSPPKPLQNKPVRRQERVAS